MLEFLKNLLPARKSAAVEKIEDKPVAVKNHRSGLRSAFLQNQYDLIKDKKMSVAQFSEHVKALPGKSRASMDYDGSSQYTSQQNVLFYMLQDNIHGALIARRDADLYGWAESKNGVVDRMLVILTDYHTEETLMFGNPEEDEESLDVKKANGDACIEYRSNATLSDEEYAKKYPNTGEIPFPKVIIG